MVYRIVPFLMILNDLQSHLPKASLFTRDFLYSCAAVDKTSTDSASRGPSAIASCNFRSFLRIFWVLSMQDHTDPQYCTKLIRPFQITGFIQWSCFWVKVLCDFLFSFLLSRERTLYRSFPFCLSSARLCCMCFLLCFGWVINRRTTLVLRGKYD